MYEKLDMKELIDEHSQKEGKKPSPWTASPQSVLSYKKFLWKNYVRAVNVDVGVMWCVNVTGLQLIAG
ncbi:hypothetical protein E2C01_022206 [Portunus trituberculatus]|uniref:Uncharacterized protein n=1 Tax=Portunus trituberculatus TaxID=210409 RepID=A0A5B7E4S0_PORTR|nr:hypothetical protein [Portunus trituberculatus]